VSDELERQPEMSCNEFTFPIIAWGFQ